MGITFAFHTGLERFCDEKGGYHIRGCDVIFYLPCILVSLSRCRLCIISIRQRHSLNITSFFTSLFSPHHRPGHHYFLRPLVSCIDELSNPLSSAFASSSNLSSPRFFNCVYYKPSLVSNECTSTQV